MKAAPPDTRLQLKLVVTDSDDRDPFELTLNGRKYRVGRRRDNDLRIRESYVSAYHSELVRDSDGNYELVDLGSSNGTFLNGHRLEAPALIQVGDAIKFGIFKARIEEDSEDSPRIVPLKDRPVFGGASSNGASAKPAESATESSELARRAGTNGGKGRHSRDREDDDTRPHPQDPDALDSRVRKLEGDLADSTKARKTLETERSALRREAKRKDEELEEARTRADRFRERIDEIAASSGTLQAELNREQAENQQMREELERSHASLARLKSDLAARDSEIDRKNVELSDKEEESDRLESEAIRELQRELEEISAGRDEALRNLERSRDEHSSMRTSFEGLRARIREVEEERDRVFEREEKGRKDRVLLEQSLDELRAEKDELATRIEQEQVVSKERHALVSQLEQELASTRQEARRRKAEHDDALRKRVSDSEEENKRTSLVEEQLARTVAEKQKAEDALEAIREDLVGARSENESTVVILQKNEKERVRLKSLLDEQTRLAEERATTIARLKRELADTEKRLEDSERSLVSHTEAEREKLEATLREQRESQATLQALLDDTRNGMSEAIRRERERAGSERNRVLSEGHARLSEVEADLGKSLRINTDLRSECDRFKQQLADRDLEIERLASEIDDLQIFNLDEKEARSALLIDFEKTKKGLSSALRFARLGIEAARKETSSERARSEALASQLEDSQSSIASMEEAQRRMRKEHEKAVAEWSKRCDRLREKRLKLVEKKSSLKQFRKQIRKAQSDRSLIEEEVSSLRLEKKRLRERNEEFEDLRRTLSTEREDLVEGIRNAREELARTERDRRDSEKRLREHAETIETIEKRIATLRQIETELGHALEKRRKEGVVSRGGVFASLPQSFAESFSFSREEFFRKLTARLDLIDDLSSRYGNRWRHQRIAKQLALLKSSFLDLLLDHSVQEFHLEPGTIVSIEERQRIKLVAPDDHVSKRSSSRASRSGDDRTKILSTIRPGYVFRDGTRDVIIRKAEVVVA